MKTVGRNLVLAGRAPRGTLYAVYTFLEDVVGCRWWTSTESFIPKKPTLSVPQLDVVYAPPLRYREAYYRDAFKESLRRGVSVTGMPHAFRTSTAATTASPDSSTRSSAVAAGQVFRSASRLVQRDQWEASDRAGAVMSDER